MVVLALSAMTHAAQVQVTITVDNLAPTNSVSFAPLHFGFNNGTFDAFNIGQVATAPIISIAEGGSGSARQPAFAAADSTATRGTISGALVPGAVNSFSVRVDTAINQFFTFALMVVPSNDLFIGNDSPTRFRLFDTAGNLLINSIGQRASDIWDNGSEIADPAAAAFVVGGTNSLRTPQNGVVSFNFSELSAFNGLTTAAGYVFNNSLAASTDIYRISFQSSVVPEPGMISLLAASLMSFVWIARRRRVPPLR